MGALSSTTIWCWCMSILFTIFFLFDLVGLPLIFTFTGSGSNPKGPTFSVESSTVKAFNLTSDNRLFCIINLGVRVRNPNPNKHSFSFAGIDMEVRKGHHHKLADDAISYFRLQPGEGSLVNVEAVGLQGRLKRKIAGEVRADAAAGEGRVNVYMPGGVGSDNLGVTCRGVSVDFSRSTVRPQSVDWG